MNYFHAIARCGYLLAGAGLLTSCRDEPLQSSLHPASRTAAQITDLWWLLLSVCTAVFVVTIGLLAFALARRARGAEQPVPPLGPTRFIVVSGIVVPSVILFIFLIAAMNTTAAMRVPDEALTIRVTGHQFWWEVHYPEQDVTIANQLHIPTGQPVKLELASADVIHSFWVPRLSGKMDLVPGHVNTFHIAANGPGTYRGQCAEYCGIQHAKMAFWVVAHPPEEFRAWLARARQPAAPPATELRERGLQAFFRTGCQQCHAIRGTEAAGQIGPELTDLGNRLTLGAGTVANTEGNLRGWIANPQAIKPGNKMPRMYIPPEDLHALTAYLQGLK